MAWTEYDVNTLLPGEPWTAAKALAAFENVPATAAGDTGAPKVWGAALDAFQGFFSVPAISGWSATIDLKTSQARKLLFHFVGSDADTKRLVARFSTDGGANFGSSQDITPLRADSLAGYFFMDLEDGDFFWLLSTVRTDTFTPPPVGTNAMQLGIEQGSAPAVGFVMVVGGKD